VSFPEELQAHLASGASTVCRAWAVTRRDGAVLGFTDHDGALSFEGIGFLPGSGMTAKALVQATGLSVDNTEAYGALSAEALTEADLLAGRYDGAEVRAWMVNWADVSQRALIFRGTLGEISRAEGAFTAELRGLSEALGQSNGRIYHPRCAAVLGDARCRFDLGQSGYVTENPVETGAGARLFPFAGLAEFEDRWFEKGVLTVLTGAAAGLFGVVKNDRLSGAGRVVELWQDLGIVPGVGDVVRITAGCDRRADTCRLKFNNFNNFRGFPHLPGEDWLISYPVSAGANDGGSLFS
jgi:uncharacterized phage protein (TIGR02218 family)